MKGVLRFGAIVALVVLSDQATKLLIVRYFQLYESLPVVPGFINLTHLTNTGAAFGFLAGQPDAWRHVFFVSIAVTALVVIFFLFLRLRRESLWYELSLALIAGGALGNLIDRIRVGSVIDFIDVHIGSHHWPAFNVADSSITVGVAVFLVYSLFFEDKHEASRGQANKRTGDKQKGTRNEV